MAINGFHDEWFRDDTTLKRTGLFTSFNDRVSVIIIFSNSVKCVNGKFLMNVKFEKKNFEPVLLKTSFSS